MHYVGERAKLNEIRLTWETTHKLL